MALDTFGFLVVAIKDRLSTELVDRRGFLDDPVNHRDTGLHQIRAKLIGPATFDEWRAQNDLFGETRIHGWYAFRKFVLE